MLTRSPPLYERRTGCRSRRRNSADVSHQHDVHRVGEAVAGVVTRRNLEKGGLSLELNGTAIFYGPTGHEPSSRATDYRMWRVLDPDRGAAHGAEGQMRIIACGGKRQIFTVGLDGVTTWTERGVTPKAEANAFWASRFGFGIIRHARKPASRRRGRRTTSSSPTRCTWCGSPTRQAARRCSARPSIDDTVIMAKLPGMRGMPPAARGAPSDQAASWKITPRVCRWPVRTGLTPCRILTL